MSSSNDLSALNVEQFADRFQSEMIPLSNTFSYFFAGLPLSEEEVKEYLEEPIAALPPTVIGALKKISIVLVPYLERLNGSSRSIAGTERVSLEKPNDNRLVLSAQTVSGETTTLIFSIKDQEVADYHYRFYHSLASLVSERWNSDAQSQFFGILREELTGLVHGEVDEASWRLKQALLRRQTNVRRETKAFRDYARQAFIDTLTLYLHGICCDIDVETGPRQLPSRNLRRRLMLLEDLYPPPSGYAVFPEELNHSH